MTYEPTEIRLKDGRLIILRSAVPEDAAQLLSFLREAYGSTDYLASYPEEIEYTVESEAAYISNAAAQPGELCLAAFHEGVLIGNTSLSCVRNRIKLRHRAELAIAILPAFRGQGLGRRLMEAAIAQAKEHGYLQVELEVVSGNLPARKLYESMGFRKQGVHERGFCLKAGTFLDLDDMVLMRDES